MTERKSQTKSANRRSHCSIDALPIKLRTVVEKMIVNNEWPIDFKKHYSGTPRHCDIVLYCKTKGHSISKSAIGRFAKQTQTVSSQKIINDFRSYALAHLGVLCMDFATLQSDLEEAYVHPGRIPSVDDRREELEKLAAEKIDRIEQVIVSLKKLR